MEMSDGGLDQEDILPDVFCDQKKQSTLSCIEGMMGKQPQQTNCMSLKQFGKEKPSKAKVQVDSDSSQTICDVRPAKNVGKAVLPSCQASDVSSARPESSRSSFFKTHRERMKSSMEPPTSPLQPSSSASSVTQDTVHTYEDDQGRCREPQPKEQVEVDQDVTELLTLGSSRSTPDSLSCVSSTGRASTLGSHSSENVVAEQDKPAMPEFMLALRQKVTIYFGNLSSKVTTGHIEDIVKKYGAFFHCLVIMGQDNGKEVASGYITIDVMSVQVAERIILEVDNQIVLCGRPVTVGMLRNSVTEESVSPVQQTRTSPARTAAEPSISPRTDKVSAASLTRQRSQPEAKVSTAVQSGIPDRVFKPSDSSNRPATTQPSMKLPRERIPFVSQRQNERQIRYDGQLPSHSQIDQNLHSYFGRNEATYSSCS